MDQMFKIGDRVYVANYRLIRTIVAFYSDIPGGVILDKPVDGFRSWNTGELRHVL